MEAWIDVGGTFTDCFVRQDRGRLTSCKVLSSGRVPISLEDRSSGAQVGKAVWYSPELAADCAGFWGGADLVQLDDAQHEISRLPVVHFQEGYLGLEKELSGEAVRFELDANLAAPVLAVRRLLQRPLSNTLPNLRIRLGTTRGTNALLTRRGAKTAFAVTAPFSDLLQIGDQTRPDLFALNIVKATPLAEKVLGVEERLDAEGRVLLPLNEDAARKALESAWTAGYESLAICLMHAYENPVHERQLKKIATEVGFREISVSHELAPLIEIVARAQTTLVDAYLSPTIRRYLQEIVEQFGGAERVELSVMSSAGGLIPWRQYSGKDSILSGPAGGVCALSAIAKATNLTEVIGLDMGGTSTDVCRATEVPEIQYESQKAGVRILTPTLPIETVAAGGGSICWFDGVVLRVGPQSAGAAPGPACYGRGGPLTITDLNVYLGRVPAEQFPFPIHRDAIESRLDALLASLQGVAHFDSRAELCRGFQKIANEQMADAVRSVSIAQGADPRGSVLVGFGGAAGQHICEIASGLEIDTILDVPEAGLLSAFGMGVARARLDATLPIYRKLEEVDWEQVELELQPLRNKLLKQMQPSASAPSSLQSWLELRYSGTESSLRLSVGGHLEKPTSSELSSRFHALHKQRFGYARESQTIELVSVRIECEGQPGFELPKIENADISNEREHSGAIRREAIEVGDQLIGPVTVLNQGSTLNVDAGWSMNRLTGGILQLNRIPKERQEHTRTPRSSSNSAKESPSVDGVLAADVHASSIQTDRADVVFRECFGARLSAIATQMGLLLQQTAVSVNIKQRRDYSCAIFDCHGNLLANAPHVPVHLGAMGKTVREIQNTFPQMNPGDVFLTNDPYRGGSHLPDLTVITPVFSSAVNSPAMFVANRAHHADIGGISPGSMSILADCLGKEGVVIPPRYLLRAGVNCIEDLREFLTRAKYPPRNIAENLDDIMAQTAANQLGSDLLTQYAEAEGWNKLNAYAEHLLDAAEQKVRQYLIQLPEMQGKAREFEDHLDDGSRIHLMASVDEKGTLRLDFSGSAGVNPRNFNANPSIVNAAVVYVLRCLIADELPMNEGILRATVVKLPVGLLNPPPGKTPQESPAVAAGNVETSQRLVDVLLGVFEAAAASQGTMNNLLFGNSRFGFYETLCGGSGATSSARGADAVHTHMTNTRLTDPEVLEKRYPVRLVQCAIRQGSGGRGSQNGGHGLIREIEFLEPVTVSLLTSRRKEYLPFGLHGGEPGLPGINSLVRNGERELLAPCCELQAQPGDHIRIETPGGGGYGHA